MKIVVIGGTGLIGSKVVTLLRALGHEVVPASPATGINTFTGEGLDEAMRHASIVVDLANSPSFADADVLEFFKVSGRNIHAAEMSAGVRHHVALSVVGTERLAQSGYFRGKIAQEKLIRESGIPYTIIHSTQFFEFLKSIVQSAAKDGDIQLPAAFFQPISSDDVASAVVKYALAAPYNGTVEIAGPERVRLSELVQRYLIATGDPRKVVEDPAALYFGAELSEDTLMPGAEVHPGNVSFATWFAGVETRH
jgi:uncharacterized protein YbjT (DUF2867 family)